MTNPSGDALMARIKELEDALRPFAEATVFQMMSNCYLMTVTAEMAQAARKALNANHP